MKHSIGACAGRRAFVLKYLPGKAEGTTAPLPLTDFFQPRSYERLESDPFAAITAKFCVCIRNPQFNPNLICEQLDLTHSAVPSLTFEAGVKEHGSGSTLSKLGLQARESKG